MLYKKILLFFKGIVKFDLLKRRILCLTVFIVDSQAKLVVLVLRVHIKPMYFILKENAAIVDSQAKLVVLVLRVHLKPM